MIEPIFASFLASEFVSVDTESLRRVCRDCEAKAPRHESGHNRAGLLDTKCVEVQQMLSCVSASLNRVFRQLGYRRDRRLEISNAWTNVGNNLHIDSPHLHPDSFFSACLYLSDAEMSGDPEERGGLRLLAPATVSRLKNTPDLISSWSAYTADAITIYPEVNKLIIFPSWIMHYVTPDRSDTERFSIAFDSRIVPQPLT